MSLTKSEIQRYKRQLLLQEIGEKGQECLKNARVLVIGAGGLANAVLPYLAGAGVGSITVVDKDTVDLSNLQRQVLFTENDIGKSKSQVVTERLLLLNSDGKYHYVNEYFTVGNAVEISKNQDVIIDCVDQIDVRYLINDITVYYQIPMVYGALHKFEGQVSVFNYKDSASYRCAFPENTKKSPSPSCEESGVVGVLPGIIGLYQAMEAIKIITGSGVILSNKIMMVDLMNNFNQNISVSRDDNAIGIAKERISNLMNKPHINEIIDISGDQLLETISENPELVIIDIQQVASLKGIAGVPVTHIPVTIFMQKMIALDPEQTVLLYCAHGVNSQWATAVLKDQNFKKIYHLVGGISAI